MKKNLFYKYALILFRDITSLGGAFFYGLVLLLLLILGEIHLLKELLLGLILTFVITIIVRWLYFRPRPRKGKYHNWAEKIDASSFPSLHAARMVFFSLAFMDFFSYQPYFILFFSLVAVLVSYSRVILKKHDWWDLLGGAVLGIISFWLSTLF